MTEFDKHTTFENILKDKLGNYEYPYDANAWKDIKKSVPGKSGLGYVIVAVVAGVLITAALCYFLPGDGNRKIAGNENMAGVEGNVDNGFSNSDNIVSENIETESDAHNILSENNDRSENIDNSEIENETPIVDIKKDVNENNTEVNDENINPIQNNQKNDSHIVKIPSAKFSADISEGCLPLPVAFKPAEVCDTAVYMWDFGDGNFSNERSPEYTYKKAGKYQVSLTMKYFRTDQVVVKVMDKKIEVFPLPVVSMKSISNEMKYNFTTECDCRNCTWYIDNNTITGNNIYYTFNDVGKYEIRLMCSNDLGCSDSVTETIEINNDLNIFIPTGFSPDGDGNNDTFGPVLSDEKLNAYAMKIFGPGGQLVFQTDNLDHSWDGKIMNTTKYADTGVYSYEIIIIHEDGNTYRRIGHVSLIR